MRTVLAFSLALPLAALAAGRAAAQEFPPDPDWEPLRCRGEVMTDGLGDEPAAIGERDLVGDGDEPAGLRAADDDFFYLRIRVDADPVAGADLQPDAWGMALDLDLDRQTYEALILADAVDGEVKLFANDETVGLDDPRDPADLPPLAVYPFEQFERAVDAGSLFNDDPDWFVDMAVPWDDLVQVGLEPSSLFRAWVASSTSGDRLDADFACHDGGSGLPSVADVESDEAVADPDDPGDGGDDSADDSGDDSADDGSADDGDGGDLPGERELQGGGGCTAGGGPGSPAAILVIGALALAIRRRRR